MLLHIDQNNLERQINTQKYIVHKINRSRDPQPNLYRNDGVGIAANFYCKRSLWGGLTDRTYPKFCCDSIPRA